MLFQYRCVCRYVKRNTVASTPLLQRILLWISEFLILLNVVIGIQSSHSKSALSPAPPRQQSFDLYLSDEGNDNDDDSDFSVGVNDDDHYD